MLRARAVMLTSYNEVARFVGLDPYAMLARCQINPAHLEDPEFWLPAANVLQVLDDSATYSQRDDFGILLGKCRSFTSLGPVSLLLKHESSVRQIILSAVEYRHLINDLLHVTVKDDGTTAIVEWSLLPGLRSAQGVNILAAIAYRAISEALETVWEPDCLHFRHAEPSNLATFNRYFRCTLEFDSHFDGMTCSSAALETPNPFADPDLSAYARGLLDLMPRARDDSAASKVRAVILLSIEDGQPTIAHAAACLGVSARTLQRRLENECTSFNELLNETRRDLAQRYLMNSSHSLTMVAQLTGYSGLSAFSNWFASEFGTSPTIWRRENQD